MKHVARKRFGQNFLRDAAVIDAILSAIGLDQQDRVVEIGPGLGALTDPLLARLKEAGNLPLHVVELDRDLIARLNRRADPRELMVHAGDALAFDFGALANGTTKLRIVGNLPYNISSPLLFHLRQWAGQIRDQHFMLQKEVVTRMTAAPGDSEFGRLSVMLQVSYHMEHLFDVPPEAFDPAPAVTSSIVRMVPDPRLREALLDEGLFAALVAQAFSQRRKMLRNTLANYAQEVPLEAAGIAASARAEEIGAPQYVDYANRIASYREGTSAAR